MSIKDREQGDGSHRPRRRFLRVLLALGLLVFTMGMAARQGAAVYVEERLLSELRALGFDDVSFEVAQIGWDHLVLTDVRLGAELHVEEVRLRFEPEEVLDGHVHAVEIRGAVWEVADLDALRASPVVRAMGRTGGGGAIPRVELVDAQIRLGSGSPDVAVITLDGRVLGAPARAVLECRSPLGHHYLEAWSRPTVDGTSFEVRARSPDSAETLALTATVPDADDAPTHVVVRGELGAVSLPGGVPGWAETVVVEGHSRVRRGRLETLALHVLVVDATVSDLPVGRVEIDATTERDLLLWSLSASPENGLRLTARGKLPSDLTRLGALTVASSDWWVEGAPGGGLLSLLSPGARLEGPAEISARGTAIIDLAAGQLRLRDVRARASLAALVVPSARASARDVELDLRANGEVDAGGWRASLTSGSRVRASRARAGDMVARAISVDAALRAESSAGGARVFGDRLRARAQTLVHGRGGERVRLGDVRARLRARGARPMLERAPGIDETITFQVHAQASRVDGVLEGHDLALRGPMRFTRGDRPRAVAALSLRFGGLEHPASGLGLNDAEVALRVTPAGRVVGDVRAQELVYDGRALCAATGRLRTGDPARLELSCPTDAAPPATLTIALGDRLPGGGRVDIRVPTFEMTERAPLSQLLAGMTDLHLSGRAGGEVHFSLDEPERGFARLTLAGARVRSKSGETDARNVRGTLELSQLVPLRSATPSQLRWSRLSLGGLDVGGAGSASLRMDEGGALDVRDMRFSLAGGRVDVSPFVLSPREPEVPLRLALHGVELGQALRSLTEGTATGRGRIDGSLSLRARLAAPRRLVIGEARLVGRGPGRIQLGNADVLGALDEWAEPFGGDLIARRIAAALVDFDYTELALTRGASSSAPIRAHIVGTGRTVPQGVDLRLNVRGLQALLDRVFLLTSLETP